MSEKSTRIDLNTQSERSLGGIPLMGCLGYIMFFFAILFAITSEDPANYIVQEMLNMPKVNEGILNAINSILAFVAILAGIVSTIIIWKNVLSNYLGYKANDLVSGIKDWRLFRRKINSDINNTDLLSSNSVKAGIKSNIQDAQKISTEVNSDANQWIDNQIIWELNESDFNQPIVNSFLANLELLDGKKYQEYKEQKKEIEKLKDNISKELKIKFFVAAVQPAFYLALKKVIKNFKLEDSCDVITRDSTGPENVVRSIDAIVNKSEKEIISFISPLSAFITLQHIIEGELCDPRNYFSPIVSLTKEKQYLFYVESKSSIPLGKRNLFYYNNSTAEESVLKMCNHIDSIYLPERIDSFSDYLQLLEGKTIGQNRKLNAGDGIMLWSPLSDYFDKRDINGNYLIGQELESTFDFDNFNESKILLFGQKTFDGLSKDEIKFFNTIIKATIQRIALDKQELSASNLLHPIRSGVNLFSKFALFQKGHKSEFRKLYRSK